MSQDEVELLLKLIGRSTTAREISDKLSMNHSQSNTTLYTSSEPAKYTRVMIKAETSTESYQNRKSARMMM